MDNVTHLGLDVHKETIAVGLLRPQDPVPDYRVIDNTPEAVRKLVINADTASSLYACYEAGPTGYDTYRLLQSLGVRCDVIAPALIPRRAACGSRRIVWTRATSPACIVPASSRPSGSRAQRKRRSETSYASGRT